MVELLADSARRDWGAIVEGVAVAAHMDQHFGGEIDPELQKQDSERVGPLLGEGRDDATFTGVGLPAGL